MHVKLVTVLLSQFFFRTCVCEDVIYKMVGSVAVLSPNKITGPVTNIVWKKGNNMAMEYRKGSVYPYREFEERGFLNISNGEMSITGVTRNDNERYTVEINNKVDRVMNLQVIDSVSKPNISKSCDDHHCNLTCEGDTGEDGPVSYNWICDKNKTDIVTKEYHLTKDENVKSIMCKLTNPVSSKESDPLHNPFTSTEHPTSSSRKYIVPLIVILILIVGIALYFLHNRGIIPIPCCPARRRAVQFNNGPQRPNGTQPVSGLTYAAVQSNDDTQRPNGTDDDDDDDDDDDADADDADRANVDDDDDADDADRANVSEVTYAAVQSNDDTQRLNGTEQGNDDDDDADRGNVSECIIDVLQRPNGTDCVTIQLQDCDNNGEREDVPLNDLSNHRNTDADTHEDATPMLEEKQEDEPEGTEG